MPPSTRSSCALPTGPGRNDLGAALASVPGRVGAVHRAPWRAPVDRRDRRRRRARDPGGQRAGAARPAHRHHEPRLPRRVRVHQRPAGVLARRARARRRRRPLPHPTRGRHRRGGLLPPRPHDARWPTSTTTRSTAVVRTWRERTACATSTRRRGARADLREPRRRGRHVEPAPALPDLRRCPRLRHDGARSRGRGRAPRADRPVAPDRRRRAGARRTTGGRATATTSSRACRGSRATRTRCTCSPVGR